VYSHDLYEDVLVGEQEEWEEMGGKQVLRTTRKLTVQKLAEAMEPFSHMVWEEC